MECVVFGIFVENLTMKWNVNINNRTVTVKYSVCHNRVSLLILSLKKTKSNDCVRFYVLKAHKEGTLLLLLFHFKWLSFDSLALPYFPFVRSFLFTPFVLNLLICFADLRISCDKTSQHIVDIVVYNWTELDVTFRESVCAWDSYSSGI